MNRHIRRELYLARYRQSREYKVIVIVIIIKWIFKKGSNVTNLIYGEKILFL